MQIAQKQWQPTAGWQKFPFLSTDIEHPDLVLVFGAVGLVSVPERFQEIRTMYPEARIVMASTAGEILGTTVEEGSLSLTAVKFDATPLRLVVSEIAEADESYRVGGALAEKLLGDGLVHVMVFSDGLHVNGTDLVKGMTEKLPKQVAVTGGLVGGGNDFEHTYVGLDTVPAEHQVVAIGFYGTGLKVSYGAMGGWDPFGPGRVITKAKKNVLYELDHQPALALYKQYLGDKAGGLPGSGLLFPLSLELDGREVVRTILAVDEAEQSITFAGDMPEGVTAQLMKANFDRLVGGAADAAEMVAAGKDTAELAILISCVGRKLVLKDRTEEEVEAVQAALGQNVVLTGFYSYGEISPATPTENQCQLHNQTMTITTLSEAR